MVHVSQTVVYDRKVVSGRIRLLDSYVAILTKGAMKDRQGKDKKYAEKTPAIRYPKNKARMISKLLEIAHAQNDPRPSWMIIEDALTKRLFDAKEADLIIFRDFVARASELHPQDRELIEGMWKDYCYRINKEHLPDDYVKTINEQIDKAKDEQDKARHDAEFMKAWGEVGKYQVARGAERKKDEEAKTDDKS